MYTVEVQDYAPVLRECFSSDPDLLSTHHIAAGSGLEGCVSRTDTDLRTTTTPGFKFYAIKDGDALAGFFGHEPLLAAPTLTSFFIHPTYRDKEGKAKVWGVINKYFKGNPFVTCIYSKNLRAEKFLLNIGAVILVESLVEGNMIKVLGFNTGVKQCQQVD